MLACLDVLPALMVESGSFGQIRLTAGQVQYATLFPEIRNYSFEIK
jgi:hypothetical protein